MRAPTFLEIWDDKEWFDYWIDNQPLRTREYFKFRSAVRMVVWVPFFVVVFYIIVGGVAVLS